jgi:hypothetical protein
MLFPYKYVNHDIAMLQEWIDFLFINVWCNAKEDYSLELLNGCSELRSIAEEEAWKEDPAKKAKDYITGPISVIYDLFKDELNDVERKQIKKWYKRSRHLEYVCDNKKLFNPITRKQFEKYSKKLADALYSFYVDLYEHALKLAVIKSKNGTLENHYKEFIKINNSGFCPFCGLSTLRGYEMEGHEAYDHYLPKETYPTYSINFKNLVPTCHGCNSIHKFRDSPLISKKNNSKQKAVYPYSLNTPEINLTIKVTMLNYKEYEHDHIDISISSKTEIDKVRTWFKLYNIEKRYKDELTNEGSGKYWLLYFLEELPVASRETEFQRLPEKLFKSKYKDKNFLKVPFLQACRAEGLL